MSHEPRDNTQEPLLWAIGMAGQRVIRKCSKFAIATTRGWATKQKQRQGFVTIVIIIAWVSAKMVRFGVFLLAAFLLLANSCTQAKRGKRGKKGRKQKKGDGTCSIGLVQVKSMRSFDDTYNTLIQLLQASQDVFIAKEFDAVMVAGMANITGLPPNRNVIFGNPQIGTPLIEADQVSAIDLPQKMHVYQTTDGEVFVGYNSPSYLDRRHTFDDDLDVVLDTIGTALRSLAANAAGVDASTINEDKAFVKRDKRLFNRRQRAGIDVYTSEVDFNTTVQRLFEAIPQNDVIHVTTVDHQETAASVGHTINPTHLILFCYPPFDATFMQSNQCSVSDFPMKMLVTQNDSGEVEVRVNNFTYLRKRHHIKRGTISESVFDLFEEKTKTIIESSISAN